MSGKSSVISNQDLKSEPFASVDLTHTPIIFKPHEGPQSIFLAAPEQEVLYGGAAGSGKTYAIIADSLRDTQNGAFAGLIIRRTNDELREIISKTLELYPRVYPSAKWNAQKSEWIFPSGSRLWLTYLERDADVMRYQGQAFSYIAVDELTQYATPYPWDYLRSRLRTTDKHLIPYCRACVDEGDVLTENGWKAIQDVIVGEKVYGLTSNGELVLRKVHTSAAYDIEEDLVRVRKKNLYMSMTADHRVLHKPQGNPEYKLTRWNEHTSGAINIARTSSFYATNSIYKCPIGSFSDNEYAEFLGLYIAEGCVNTTVLNGNYKVVITQSKVQNHNFVNRLFAASGYRYNYSRNGDFQITNKALREHFLPLGKAKDKHFPREFLNTATKEQLQLAFDAYMLGDGHWQSETAGTATTTSPQLKDDLLEIGIKLGYKVQFNIYISDNPKHNDKIVVYFRKCGDTTKVEKGTRNDVSLEHYKGKVYCLGVEEIENFVLRQDKYVWVSGNTSNPGGPGHRWVKKMFIDPAPWGKPFPATDIETGAELRWPENHHNAALAGKPLFYRRFIPGKLKDNPSLYDDGKYEANLLSLPEHQRKQLLEGSWDIVEGAAFGEFNREIHTCKPFPIPSSWRKFRAADYGYTSQAGCLWFAINPEGQLIIYRELYTRLQNAPKFATAVLDMEQNDGGISYGIMDSSVFHHKGDIGVSIAEQMMSVGCQWRPSDRSKGSRINGKNELHRRFEVNSITEKPGIVIFNTCVNLIAQLPLLQLDKTNSEDVDTKGEDHLYDALRYGLMSRPTPAVTDFMILNRPSLNEEFAPADSTFGY